MKRPRDRAMSSTASSRAGRRQARGRDRVAQPLAPHAARREAARGSAAQEHPDDRADRGRQDRDPPAASPGSPARRSSRSRPPSSPRSAMSGATSSRSCATWSRSRSRRCASASARTWRPAQLAAEDRVVDALAGTRERRHERSRFRRKLRSGEMNDKEIEIEVQSSGGGMPMFEIPGMPGAQMGAISIGDIFGKMGRPHQDPARHGEGGLRAPGQRGVRQAARPRAAGAGGDPRGRAERHRVPRRDRQDHRRARAAWAPTFARGRAARPAAADRGHHRLHQARRGEDRPRPVHRVGRVSCVEAVRPAARAAGPAADPRRAEPLTATTSAAS